MDDAYKLGAQMDVGHNIPQSTCSHYANVFQSDNLE